MGYRDMLCHNDADMLSSHISLRISSALYNNSFRLEDFGGTGDFVAEGNRNRFYVQGTGINNGTMRWRPDFSAEEIKALGTRDKLFHPLKRESYE